MWPFPHSIINMATLEHRLATTLIVFITNVVVVYSQALRAETMSRNNELCKKVGVEPYFEPEMVLGKPWRIYYTWNIKIEDKCLDMAFKNATPQIVQRIWSDMYDYLEQQPVWDAATLHASMGKARHELLLFADQGAAGSFVAVPNVIRDGNIAPVKQGVPLLKFQFKMLREGRFLLMTDCHVGVSSLSARASQPPYRSEILATVGTLQLGDGFLACISDKNKDEQLLID